VKSEGLLPADFSLPQAALCCQLGFLRIFVPFRLRYAYRDSIALKETVQLMIPVRRICGGWRGILLLACLFATAEGTAQKKSAPKPNAQVIPAPVPEALPKEEPPPVAPAPKPDPLGRSTPYGCVIGFLKAVNDNDLTLAIRYLDTKLPDDKAEELAKQLKAVLDATLPSNLNKISKAEEGSLRNDLGGSRESIGVAKTPKGDLDILLNHVPREDKTSVWLFDSATLAEIPEIYSHIQEENRFAFLPEPLRTTEFWGLPLWRWIGIFLSLVIAILLSTLVTRILLWLFRVALDKGKIRNEEEILRKLNWPVRIILLSLAIALAAEYGVTLLARHYWGSTATFLGVIGVGWLLTTIIDISADAGTRRLVATGMQHRTAIITLCQRLAKIFVALAVFLILLREAGVNISAMLTGLGIGGIALALAAQNALQDLFGGISIIVRDTIRVGDFCRVADQTGLIQDIGLSSTRLRTLDRTIVSIPNSKIAQLSSENYTLRDKFWFHHFLSFRPDTSRAQLDRIVAGIKTIFRENSDIEVDGSRVCLIGFQEASFRIELFAYLRVATYPEFLERQQHLLLSVMTRISGAGAQLAMTSQTTYLEFMNSLQEAKKEEAK
jgi:MscS family membrane protein